MRFCRPGRGHFPAVHRWNPHAAMGLPGNQRRTRFSRGADDFMNQQFRLACLPAGFGGAQVADARKLAMSQILNQGFGY